MIQAANLHKNLNIQTFYGTFSSIAAKLTNRIKK